MKETLKVTNVLSDPTRFNVYQHLIKHRKEVTVQDIAKKFSIHPNVARLHLSKLEDINLVESYTKKTGKGGRPSRVYQLSDEVVELNFPHRDYKLLAKIAIESLVELGDPGQEALYKIGKQYGMKIVENHKSDTGLSELTIDEKLFILEDMSTALGFYPELYYDKVNKSISFKINNCPIKEVVPINQTMVCKMHFSFLEGMFEALFSNVELSEKENIFSGCKNCSYVAELLTV